MVKNYNIMHNAQVCRLCQGDLLNSLRQDYWIIIAWKHYNQLDISSKLFRTK